MQCIPLHQVKYLGLLISSDVSWSNHIKAIEGVSSFLCLYKNETSKLWVDNSKTRSRLLLARLADGFTGLRDLLVCNSWLRLWVTFFGFSA